MNITYQRPRKLEVVELKENYGRFEAEPFERGYGTTLGIALRRVLLSLIEGAAITAVRIEGVLHEFSSIPGVYEDVLNIILNLKTVPFKLNVDEPRIVRIEKKGGEITSADIITDSDVEVLDKNIHVAFTEEGTDFNCEMIVKKGVGFKLTEHNLDEELAVDFIPVDSNFSPIDRVKYSIRPARVGKKTDYEKLILEIWTNGGINSKEALSRASMILRDHLSIFINFQDKEVLSQIDEPEATASTTFNKELLEKSVDAMGLSVRALKCLKRLGVDYIFELIEKTEHELLNSKNFGKKSLEEIIQKLQESDLALGQKLPLPIKENLIERLKKTDNTEETEEEKE